MDKLHAQFTNTLLLENAGTEEPNSEAQGAAGWAQAAEHLTKTSPRMMQKQPNACSAQQLFLETARSAASRRCSANENLHLDISFHKNSVWEHTRNALFLGPIHLCAAGSSIPEGHRILPCRVRSVHDFVFHIS